MPRGDGALRASGVVGICGAVNLLLLTAFALLSPWLNLLKPLSVRDGRIPFFRRVAAGHPLLGGWLPEEVAPRSDAFLLGYLGPILLSTALVVGLLVWLHRQRSALPGSLPRQLLLFAVAFAAVSSLGLPILADDFFVSIAWGRMVRAGVNPYYAAMDAVFAIDTPIEDTLWPWRMSYGPLWAALVGAVTTLAAGGTVASAILLKALGTGAWIGCLLLLRALLAGRSCFEQCAGMLLFGWLPLGTFVIVGDGRNDAFVALLVLAWLHARHRGRPLPAVLALTASVGIKYVTAPLFLLDLLHHARQRRAPLRAYLPAATAALAAGLVIFLPFHAGQDVWGYVAASELLAIQFLSLRNAVMTLEVWTGLGLGPLPELTRLVFPALAAAWLARYARAPDFAGLHVAALAVLCAVLFGLGGIVLPWYLSWLLAVAALEPGAWLSRWIFALTLCAPALLMPANAFPSSTGFVRGHVAALVFYLAALAGAALLERPLRGDPTPREGPWRPDAAPREDPQRHDAAPRG